jgi:hypothetical protein
VMKPNPIRLVLTAFGLNAQPAHAQRRDRSSIHLRIVPGEGRLFAERREGSAPSCERALLSLFASAVSPSQFCLALFTESSQRRLAIYVWTVSGAASLL